MKKIGKILIIILVLFSLIYTVHNYIVFRHYENKAQEDKKCTNITLYNGEPSEVCFTLTLEDAGTRDWAKTKTIVFGITTLAISLLYLFWIKFGMIPVVRVFIILLLVIFSLPIVLYTFQIVFMAVTYGIRPIHYLEYIYPKL